MPGTATEMPFARPQAIRQVIRIGLEVSSVGDEEFELLTEQAFAKALPVIDLKLHPRFRVTADERADRARDQSRRWRRATTETQLARFQAIELADLVGHLLRAADQSPRMFEQHLTLFGRRQVLAPAIDQLTADAVFQRLNAAAERRLRQVHRLRAGDEAALFSQGDEVTKLTQVDMHFSHKKYPGNALDMH